MLTYVAIAFAGILVAALLVWVTRSLTKVSRDTYRTFHGNARPAGGRFAHLNDALEPTPAPWGWGGRGVARGARYSNAGSVRGTPGGKLSASAYSDASHDAQQTGAVRSVLTGYDMARSAGAPDTSCWPYRENITSPSISFEDDEQKTSAGDDRPSKPWGW